MQLIIGIMRFGKNTNTETKVVPENPTKLK